MSQRGRTLELISGTFAVAQLGAGSRVPAWAHDGPLVSVTRTHEELSIVCADASVPPGVKAARGFRCLRVAGPLDFADTGVLESVARPLAEAAISLFAFSTYNTDYLLLAGSDLEAGLAALSAAGHSVHRVGAA